ncbi:MAG: hypothetical protein ABFS02_14540 [Pseudomonadota bacterium]
MLIGTIHAQYLEKLRNFAARFSMGELPEPFLMETSGCLSSYYAPFDAVNDNAQVVLVGITPGIQQAVNAFNAAKAVLNNGGSFLEAVTSGKATGSFSGNMRAPLIEMLDHVGLQAVLGLDSCAQLFGARRDLIHTTSVLRYPVLRDGKNYNGTPSMTKDAFLRERMKNQFAEEVQALPPTALYVPLGPNVSAALEYLAEHGVIDRGRVMSGLPHPSGANAERIAYFLGKKAREALSNKTNPEKLDAAKDKILARLGSLQFGPA